MLKYKLAVVEEQTRQLPGTNYPIITYREDYCIGYFNDEKSLAKWAKTNDGELAKVEGK